MTEAILLWSVDRMKEQKKSYLCNWSPYEYLGYGNLLQGLVKARRNRRGCYTPFQLNLNRSNTPRIARPVTIQTVSHLSVVSSIISYLSQTEFTQPSPPGLIAASVNSCLPAHLAQNPQFVHHMNQSKPITRYVIHSWPYLVDCTQLQPDGLSLGLTSHSTLTRSYWRHSPQPISWLVLRTECRHWCFYMQRDKNLI